MKIHPLPVKRREVVTSTIFVLVFQSLRLTCSIKTHNETIKKSTKIFPNAHITTLINNYR